MGRASKLSRISNHCLEPCLASWLPERSLIGRGSSTSLTTGRWEALTRALTPSHSPHRRRPRVLRTPAAYVPDIPARSPDGRDAPPPTITSVTTGHVTPAQAGSPRTDPAAWAATPGWLLPTPGSSQRY